MAYKSISAQYQGHCKACGLGIAVGDSIVYETLHKKAYCSTCGAALQTKAVADALKAKALAGLKTKTTKATVPPPPVQTYHAHTPKPVVFGAQGFNLGQGAAKTQKGKGIQVLQAHGLLPKAMAIVCQTEGEAVAAFQALGGKRRFARPAPTSPRHGFVDSREVTTEEEVRMVWAETRAADPLGEVILMPLVEAEFNCVWRPGLLAIGPGHDGATAGHDSISVFLNEAYSKAWKDLALKAGVKLRPEDPSEVQAGQEYQTPFIESVSNRETEVVITQVRGGSEGCPSEPDWVPAPMTVGAVIVKDGSVKADPQAMLAWEEEAKHLKPGYHIVYDEGGNQGDHWTVHAQLNGIAVVTTFKPQVGQQLPKMGVDLVPFEPQAVIWGFLGGLGGPSLKAETPANRMLRTRATVAAIMGTHHGMRMGGDAGVHLGASVALFLRLGQAAVWGEARHAFSHCSGFNVATVPGIKPCQGKSRQQIFTSVLDDWQKGRAGLRDVTRCFHGKWSGSFGGKAWAAISHSIVALDAAMVDLVNLPSQTNVVKVMQALTTAVNLAHNGGGSCFLNKFCGTEWFDLAAALDPRAACMAGPVWYQAAQTGADTRMAFLVAIEGMEPIDVGMKAPEGNVLELHTQPEAQTKLKGVGSHGSILDIPNPVYVPKPKPGAVAGGKVGSFGTVDQHEIPEGIPGVPVKAQAKADGHHTFHMQIEVSSGGYVSGEVVIKDRHIQAALQALQAAPEVGSMGGSGVTYHLLDVAPTAITIGGVHILGLTV